MDRNINKAMSIPNPKAYQQADTEINIYNADVDK